MHELLEGYEIVDPHDSYELQAGPFWFKKTKDGPVTAVLLTKQHTSTGGAAHGGLLMTLADLTMIMIGNAAIPESLVTLSINANFSTRNI